ncbi:MAG: hypothetical protein CMG74_10520 [Candidatus Marinimicrobia bacterium]|nr:hypothetical protein [Candidatus Neomarinimicrobiota bacterium]|tara:strand:- start:29577 stop:31187 length:1611 start_codon:yes stop_codon:yes gene_type:complete
MFINLSSNIRSIIYSHYNSALKFKILEAKYPSSKIFVVKRDNDFLSDIINDIDKQNVLNLKFHIFSDKSKKLLLRDRLFFDHVSQFDILRKKKKKYYLKYLIRRLLKLNNKYPYDLSFRPNASYDEQKKVLVFTDQKQTLDKSIFELNKKKSISILWTDLIPKYQKQSSLSTNEILIELNKHIINKNLFSYAGLKLNNSIIKYIKIFFEEYFPIFYYNHKNFIKIQKMYRFDIFISPYELPLSELICDQFSILGLPSYNLLHGGTAGIIEGKQMMYDMQHDRNNHSLFVYTDAIKENIEKNKKITNGGKFNIISTGSDYHKTIRERPIINRSSDIKNICYVVGPFGSNLNNHIKIGISSECIRYKIYRKFIDIYLKSTNNKKYKLYIKLGYNIEKSNLDYFQKIIINNNGINYFGSNMQIVKLIDKIDLFIFDTLSSPLLEICSTNKNAIFLHDDQTDKVNPNVLRMIKKRFIVFNSTKDFFSCFEDLVNNNSYDDLFSSINNNNYDLYNKFCNNNSSDSSSKISNFIVQKNFNVY